MNTSITLNSVLLISFSKMFQNLITCDFEDSAVRKFHYSNEFFFGVARCFRSIFGLFHCQNSIELNLCNILDLFQLSVYFQVDQLELFCRHYLSTDPFSKEEISGLLKIANCKNQFYFVDQNLDLFSNLSEIDNELIPLRITFIVTLMPVVDPLWLFKCLIELYKDDHSLDPKTDELLKNPEFGFLKPVKLLDSIGDCEFISTPLDWSIFIFQNVNCFSNIPP
ncbi:hypothetical protein GEMRC1_013136 [Eukaryota sp. GEM-RC1]